MRRAIFFGAVLGALLLAASSATAQQSPDLDRGAEQVRKEIEAARKRLAARREEITGARIELNRQVSVLTAELEGLREEWRRKQRLRDDADTTLEGLRTRAEGAEDRVGRLRSLLVEVRRNAEAQLNLADAAEAGPRFEEIDRLLEAGTDPADAASAVLDLLADHAEAVTGVRRAAGPAMAPDGREFPGTFVRIGDAVSLFAGRGADAPTGIVTLEHGSPRPHVFADVEPSQRAGIRSAAEGEEGVVPIDVTSGAALRKQEASLSLWEQFLAGGVVMYPILAIALLGIVVGLLKSVALLRVRTDFDGPLDRLLELLRGAGEEAPREFAERARPPLRAILLAGVAQRDSSRADLEEALNEAILSEAPPLERYLSVLSVGAAVAPLLGLLGTVTGMIHTFRLISVFGTGDPRLLSAGISEALITTEAGLVVAIPLLLLHAFLSRRANSISDKLEAAAIGFANRLRGGEDRA